MKTLKLAFLGGCINKQTGILPHLLYHQQLKQRLEATADIQIEIAIGSYLSYSKIATRAEKLLGNTDAEVLVVYLRPFTLMPLVKPLVKHEHANGSKSMALHPAMLNRNSFLWPDNFTLFQSSNEYVFTNRKRFELRDINLICGVALGLNSWANRFIENQIGDIKKLCVIRNVDLILISPSRNPESIVGNYICKTTAKHFEKHCLYNGIDYIDFSHLSAAYFEKDRVHINEQAHAVLSDLLFNKLQNTLHQPHPENALLTV